jgi:hypothetical protein
VLNDNSHQVTSQVPDPPSSGLVDRNALDTKAEPKVVTERDQELAAPTVIPIVILSVPSKDSPQPVGRTVTVTSKVQSPLWFAASCPPVEGRIRHRMQIDAELPKQKSFAGKVMPEYIKVEEEPIRI